MTAIFQSHSQGQSASQDIQGKQQVWAIETFKKENHQLQGIYIIFHLKRGIFCPDFLWIREDISELPCNALQKELLFRVSAIIEMFKHLK